jgi:hypothetical protein
LGTRPDVDFESAELPPGVRVSPGRDVSWALAAEGAPINPTGSKIAKANMCRETRTVASRLSAEPD